LAESVVCAFAMAKIITKSAKVKVVLLINVRFSLLIIQS